MAKFGHMNRNMRDGKRIEYETEGQLCVCLETSQLAISDVSATCF